MNTSNNNSFPDSEERFEVWLSNQPLTPAPDFVARTLQRIRAETALVNAAKSGNDAAVDALLDRWLSEQPLEPEIEADNLATQTRFTATREEQEEFQPAQTPGRHLILFPAWARPVIALAAAAAVALLAYFGAGGPVTQSLTNQVAKNSPVNTGPASVDADDTIDSAHAFAWASDPNYLSQLNDSVADGSNVLNPDDVDLLLNNQSGSNDDAAY